MKIKELLRHLTKYYQVFIGKNVYEDQSIVSEAEGEKEVDTFDFYSDPCEGESIVIRTKGR